MSNSAHFQSSKKFYATEHFPYGIDRSGEFTREQTQLLIDHGTAYQALADGTREPVSSLETDFVAFCQGEKEAVSKHEKVWQLFCSKISRPRSTVKSPLATIKSKPVDLSEGFADESID